MAVSSESSNLYENCNVENNQDFISSSFRILGYYCFCKGSDPKLMQILGFGEYIGEVQAAYEQHKNETLVRSSQFAIHCRFHE